MDLLTICLCLALLLGSFIIISYFVLDRILRIPRISNLDSRWILITGCDTGFGNAIAKRLDSLGCNVIAACLTESGETELRKSCSRKLHTMHLDVSNSQSVKKAYGQVVDILPQETGLWGLVNNAGVGGRAGPTEWSNLDDYRKTAAVNLFGLIDVTLTFLPLVKKAKGRIVNVSSVAGRAACTQASYCISKYGVEAFSDSLRRDMRHFNVSVSIVEPALFKTNISDYESVIESYKSSFENLSPLLKEEYGQDYLNAVCKNYKFGYRRYATEDITPVLDAYTHALFGKYPRARYVVGRSAWVTLLAQTLPEWLGDHYFSFLLSPATPAACKTKN